MNPGTSVDWAPALAVLAAGLVFGTVLVWRVLASARASRPAHAPAASEPAHPPLLARDLVGRRDALLLQLRELDDTSSKRTPDQLAHERYALELEAAEVLLALDEKAEAAAPPARPAPEPAAPAAPAAASGTRGFLWGLVTAGAIGGLFVLVWQGSRPRTEGGSVTGDLPNRPAAAEPAPGSGPEEAALRARVEKNPGDVEAQIELAQAALARQDMMAVWNATKAVLEVQPGHPQALSYQALVRLAMGQGDKALELLETAIKSDPDLLDSYLHLALVHVRMGKPEKADQAIAEAARRFPAQADDLRTLLVQMKQARPEAAEATPAEADPHAGLATPAPAPPAAGGAPSAASGGRRIAGRVEVDPSVADTLSPKAVLFVFAREAGFGAGPPIAARRLPAASFPVAFELTEADAMMGQSFPDSLLVEARLDADGDPTTRPPTDPKARLDDVKAGRTDVTLRLTRPQ
jgi:cytochrome c-type biogenesis protein CcmH